MVPALGRIRTLSLHTRPVDLAEPSTNVNVAEATHVALCEHLAKGAWVEFVDHLAVGFEDGVVGVGFELGIVGEEGESEACAVFVGNGDVVVAALGERYCRCGSRDREEEEGERCGELHVGWWVK